MTKRERLRNLIVAYGDASLAAGIHHRHGEVDAAKAAFKVLMVFIDSINLDPVPTGIADIPDFEQAESRILQGVIDGIKPSWADIQAVVAQLTVYKARQIIDKGKEQA